MENLAENPPVKPWAPDLGTCIYCGFSGDDENPLNEEHVVPRTLFINGLPKDILELSACKKCNTEKSVDDTYLRDMIMLDDQVSDHPDQPKHAEKILRAFKRKQSRVAWTALTKGRDRPFFTKAGILLGTILTVPLDEEQVNRIFSWLTKGLYYVMTKGRRMPDNYKVKAVRIHPTGDLAFLMGFFRGQGVDGFFRVGGEVFGCCFIDSDIEPSLSIWWFCFFNRLNYIVTTEPSILPVVQYYRRKPKR